MDRAEPLPRVPSGYRLVPIVEYDMLIGRQLPSPHRELNLLLSMPYIIAELRWFLRRAWAVVSQPDRPMWQRLFVAAAVFAVGGGVFLRVRYLARLHGAGGYTLTHRVREYRPRRRFEA